MHVRVRVFGNPTDSIVIIPSKLTKIDAFRKIIHDKLGVPPKNQRLFYGGKLLENGYTFHDYSIKMNDVIQLMRKSEQNHDDKSKKDETPVKDSKKVKDDKKEDEEINYTDAESTLYVIGDLVDMRSKDQGAWFEGKVVRIVHNPAYQQHDENKPDNTISSNDSQTSEKENESEKNILLYKVDSCNDGDDPVYCEVQDIRPRARNEIPVEKLVSGQTVMVNHNIDEPAEKGFWYDFTVDKVLKMRTNYRLEGTIFIGADAVPEECTIKVHDKIFAIEKVVPLAERTEEYKTRIAVEPEKRSGPLNCLACRDVEETPCKECGCYICSGKKDPEKIILCDECNMGFHLECLSPPLSAIPEEDWYCPSCRRDPADVVAPGAGKQRKKTTETKRDWGRGMACVGKTKACLMSLTHFGPIPGIEVGMCWRFRIQLSESGVHRPPVSGIHGRESTGAYSIVLSGGYEDDVDDGDEFTYTGSGGRDLSGNKRTAGQSCDQTLTRENKALARNCAVSGVRAEGADAGEDWRSGRPVRVVRSFKMLKHAPKYAPKEGIRYDGLYKVVKYYPATGLSGFRVWKYLLRRDDPSPAPWEEGAKQFPVIYPEGYLEAEEEKRKSLKRPLSSPSDEPKSKKRPPKKGSEVKMKLDLPTMFNKAAASDAKLTEDELSAIKADTENSALWDECLAEIPKGGKKDFVERLREVFRCIICQDVLSRPINTPCKHLFCFSCIKTAFKVSQSQACPYCRGSLSQFEPAVNQQLTAALRALLPGYDAHRK